MDFRKNQRGWENGKEPTVDAFFIRQMNRKKLINSKNIFVQKTRFRNFLIEYISQFFEMHYLYIMWLYS